MNSVLQSSRKSSRVEDMCCLKEAKVFCRPFFFLRKDHMRRMLRTLSPWLKSDHLGSEILGKLGVTQSFLDPTARSNYWRQASRFEMI